MATHQTTRLVSPGRPCGKARGTRSRRTTGNGRQSFEAPVNAKVDSSSIVDDAEHNRSIEKVTSNSDILDSTRKPKNTIDPSRRETLVSCGGLVSFVVFAATPQPSYARQTAVVRSDPVSLGEKANAKQSVVLKLQLPNEYHLTKGAKSKISVTLDDAAINRGIVVDTSEADLQDDTDIKLRFSFATGTQSLANVPTDNSEAGEAKIECAVYFCRENDVCLLQRVRFEVPFGLVGVDDSGLTQAISETTQLRFDIPANEPPPPVNAAAIPTFD